MDEGFLRLSRRFFSNEMWKVAREFSECEAWLDLIQSARFDATDKAHSELIGGREISYTRGQYPASISFLMKRWKWSDKKVRYFLDKLKKKGMITTCNKQGMNVITLCNYEEYNPAEKSCTGKAKGEDKDIDTSFETNELQMLGASLRAELRAAQEEFAKKLEELGQAKGDKKKKEEEREYTDISPNQKKENTPNGVSKKENLSLPSPLAEKVDYNGLMGYYNATFKDKLPQIKSMTDVRKKAVKARIAQYGKESVRTAFNLILQSPFLLGENDRNWKCDFDWIFKQANFTKILEGNYNGKRTDTAATRRESVSRLKELAGEILRSSPTEKD